MKVTCAIVNCKYSSEKFDSSGVVFVRFPSDETSKVWAEKCGRQDLLLKSIETLSLNYYVCSNHFEDRYFINKENPVILHQGSVPTLFADSINMPLTDALTYCDMNVELSQYHNISVRVSNLCRVCGESAMNGIEIFSERGDQLGVKEKIRLHLPVSVDTGDIMPQKICFDCYAKLESMHLLVINCIQTDMRFRRFLNIDGVPNYDFRFQSLLEQCTLDELNGDMCMSESIANDPMSFESSKEQDVSERVEEELHLANLNDEADCFASNSKTEITAELSNFFQDLKKDCSARNTTDKAIIICLRCNDTFKTDESYEHHKILCNDKGKAIDGCSDKPEIITLQLIVNSCDTCSQVFDAKELLDEHKLNCRVPEKWQCQICDKNFPSNAELLSHELTHRSVSIGAKKICGHCHESYATRKEVQDHITEKHEGKMLFKCNVCVKAYEKWNNLDVHEATHRTDKPYLCDLCGKRFKHSNNLRGHKRTHLDDSKKKRHVCQICSSAFRSGFHLREHMNQHNDTRPYVCDQCPKAFYKRVQLRQHKLSHGQHKYVCQICGQAFNRRGNLSSHIKRHSSSDGTYTCSVCEYRCQTMSELKMHRKEHTDHEIIESVKRRSSDKVIWQCNVCDRVFSKRSALQSHEKVHTGERSTLECDECGKRLANKSSLSYHKKSMHSSERPHACQFCGDSFVSKDARLVHERIHTGERPYTCQVCHMQYRCSSNLNQHMRTHSQVRPHVCQYCSKGFTRRGALLVHERIHTGIKPFACQICNRTFSQKNDMLKHAKTHDLKTLQCQQCNKVFLNKREMLKHHLEEHDEENSSVIQSYIQVSTQLDNYSMNIECPE